MLVLRTIPSLGSVLKDPSYITHTMSIITRNQHVWTFFSYQPSIPVTDWYTRANTPRDPILVDSFAATSLASNKVTLMFRKNLKLNLREEILQGVLRKRCNNWQFLYFGNFWISKSLFKICKHNLKSQQNGLKSKIDMHKIVKNTVVPKHLLCFSENLLVEDLYAKKSQVSQV